MNQFRIGSGYDAHRFAEGRPLILCGVTIPYDRGLAGHSDADAAAHALTDALLGALALGDIGKMFPDTDDRPEFAEWSISNINITIVAQRPKISPFTAAMRERIAEALGIAVDQISIKGKTTEGMGFCGRGEGVETYATVLLERK